METLWFAILAVTITTYAVLDGFDFGVGAVHLFVARTDEERRSVIAAIGPVWDGNEVWLVVAGGTLVFAFPRAYAAAFSGLYLPLMIVLWLLVLRGVAIEVRSKLDDPLWRAGWDGVFAFASAVMAVVLGVALGNVVRGVPLDASGWFQEDLFAFGGAGAGAIDGYTAMLGVFALVTLAAHGATYLAMKTTGPVNERSRALGRRLWGLAIAMAVAATALTAVIQRPFFAPVLSRPWIWPLPAGALASGVLARSWIDRREVAAFLASCAFVALLLVATGCALFPVILRSTTDEAFTLDVHRASAGSSLGVGLAVWVPAIVLAIGYFVFLFRTFRGKVAAGEGH